MQQINQLTYVTSLQSWIQQAFAEAEAEGMLFIGAAGIAVRTIAPYLKGKTLDPAVVVIDEMGQFVIPILSGHWGGANELAKDLAKEMKAIPVITTATDVQGKLAIDTWARKQGISLDMKIAKKISAALLKGKTIGFYSDFPYDSLPQGFQVQEQGEIGISISLDERKKPFCNTLCIQPPIVSLGIGCKKNTSCSTIKEAVFSVLKQHHIAAQCIQGIYTIEAKKEEPGLIAFCEAYGWTLKTYTTEELAKAEGEFTSSSFVLQQMGIDNVCERAAVLSGNRLIIKKTVYHGVTIAAAVKDWSVVWDE